MVQCAMQNPMILTRQCILQYYNYNFNFNYFRRKGGNFSLCASYINRGGGICLIVLSFKTLLKGKVFSQTEKCFGKLYKIIKHLFTCKATNNYKAMQMFRW